MRRPKRKPDADVPLGPNPSSRRHGAFTPLGVLAIPALSPGEKLCLGYLNYCSAGKNSCDVYRKTIAVALGVTIKTATRMLDGLESAGFIRTKRNGPERPNTYFLLPHPAIVATRIQKEKDHEWRERTASTEGTNMSTEYPGTEGTEMSLQDGTEGTNMGYRKDIFGSTEGTNMSTPYKEHKKFLQEVNTRSKQASSEPEVLTEPESTSLACLPSPFNESENQEEQAALEPEFDDFELIRKALKESGVTILGAEPEKLLELAIAASPTCPVEIIAEFISAKAAEKTGDKTIRYSSFYLKAMADLPVWLNTAAGKAARGILQDRYANPTNEQDRKRADLLADLNWIDRIKKRVKFCDVCNGSGLHYGKWCDCETGKEAQATREPVFFKGERHCKNCASTLRYHLVATPDKKFCAYCAHPGLAGTRDVSDYEIAMARAKFDTSLPVKDCVCKKDGLIIKNGFTLNETREYCKCRFGEILRAEKGDNWPAEEDEANRRELLDHARKFPKLYPQIKLQEAV